MALTVADLDRSLRYYVERIGLTLHARTDGAARLGVDGRDLLLLHEQPGARRVAGVTGLYHFALLVPTRLDLACTLRRLAETATPLAGASDHAVSEALYLTDPDGHGIEIYRDRPRREWVVVGGELQLTVDPLDLRGILSESADGEEDWRRLPVGTVMGHIHLHVSHMAEALRFYVDVLGFDLMARYGAAASFVATGGYHHQLGLNTWAGVGAPPPPEDASRLLWYELGLPDGAALAALRARLVNAGATAAEDKGDLLVSDPAGNRMRLTVLTPSSCGA